MSDRISEAVEHQENEKYVLWIICSTHQWYGKTGMITRPMQHILNSAARLIIGLSKL